MSVKLVIMTMCAFKSVHQLPRPLLGPGRGEAGVRGHEAGHRSAAGLTQRQTAIHTHAHAHGQCAVAS